MKDARDEFRRNLRASVAKAMDQDGQFRSEIFFKEWFKERGSAYYFLFKKNLSVTNIQFAELLALLRKYAIPVKGFDSQNLQFLSTRDFNGAIDGLTNALAGPGDAENTHASVVSLYADLLSRLVVVNTYFGSAAVFFPPGLSIDLGVVCGVSGYIHSCGNNIYVRNVNKATKIEFVGALEDHLSNPGIKPKKGKPIPFAVYAHEDFTNFDRYMSSDLSHGLDDVKIYVEKLYMGSSRLVSVLDLLRDKFDRQLEIPEPGDYRESYEKLIEERAVDSDRTIWLIQDKSIGNGLRRPGEERYYICYEQLYSNGNPFHVFDENKPAWIDHTTIPHTLMGAMINITAPGWPKAGVKLADPFVGSGTALLESMKYDAVDSECTDYSPIANTLVKDNLEIFCSDAKTLNELCKQLDKITREKRKPIKLAVSRAPSSEAEPNIITLALGSGVLSIPVIKKGEEINIDLTDAVVSEMQALSVFERVQVYLAFRTLRRNIGAFLREEGVNWNKRYRDQAETLLDEMKRLMRIRLRYEEQSENRPEENICITTGTYSEKATINFANFKKWTRVPSLVERKNIKEGLKRNVFDVIVTDPPYGFNTNESISDLAELYARAIRYLVGSLKDNGHLVLCLPERSYIGRRSPAFTHKDFVIQQVLAAADQFDREVFSPGASVPRIGVYKPPYYWESDKALARNIVHFRFRSRFHERTKEAKEKDDNQLSLI